MSYIIKTKEPTGLGKDSYLMCLVIYLCRKNICRDTEYVNEDVSNAPEFTKLELGFTVF